MKRKIARVISYIAIGLGILAIVLIILKVLGVI